VGTVSYDSCDAFVAPRIGDPLTLPDSPADPSEQPGTPANGADRDDPADQPAGTSSPADAAAADETPARPPELGGQKGPEPTRYGDWEKGGRCTDF